MKTGSNDAFKKLIQLYEIPENLDFKIRLPGNIKRILKDKIVQNRYGITLKSLSQLHEIREGWENRSIIEDSCNHFHVPQLNKKNPVQYSFKLSIKTLLLMSKKFIDSGYDNMRFWLSFSTPEQSREWAKQNKLHEEGNEYYISDRLAFHCLREGESVYNLSERENPLVSLFWIDI